MLGTPLSAPCRVPSTYQRQSLWDIEEAFGWIKTVGGLRKTRHLGTALVGWMFALAAAAYNVVRISKLLAAAA